MYDYFTPKEGATGGVMIGLSAASLLLFNGKILGCSGLLNGTLLSPKKVLTDASEYWRLVFVTSFSLTTAFLLGPESVRDVRLLESNDPIPIPSALAYSLSGLLVGWGSRLANGCISGHGICGMSRLSKRSLTSVGSFMATAVASAVALNPTASWSSLTAPLRTNILPKTDTTLGLLFVSTLTLGTLAAPFLANNKKKEAKKESSSADEEEEISNGWKTLLPAAFAGASLAAGLAKSGMVVASKLYSFLDFSGIADGRWDPTPALVLGIAVPISMLSYQLVDGWSLVGGMKKPLCAAKFGVPQNSVVDSNLVLGSACLGIGWSVGVCCPGAAMLKAALGDIPIFQYWIPAYIFGSLLAQKYKDYQSSSGVKPKTL